MLSGSVVQWFSGSVVQWFSDLINTLNSLRYSLVATTHPLSGTLRLSPLLLTAPYANFIPSIFDIMRGLSTGIRLRVALRLLARASPA